MKGCWELKLGSGLIKNSLTQHFTYKENGKNWAICQGKFVIGCMYFVPPTTGVKFYMRAILTVTKGPRSFEDLRTFNGTLYNTFCKACIVRGLLEDDSEWL